MEDVEEREPQLPPKRVPHIKKRTLKNKSLSISFDEKSLRDYVTGFHKRKKKRRKEAQKKQEEALRRKRIEARKKRKLERALAYGTAPPTDSISEGGEEQDEDEGESEPTAPVNATTTYDDGAIKVTVTTSEILREDEDDQINKTQAAIPRLKVADKKHNLAVNKKTPFKKVSRPKFRAKPHRGERDKKKGTERNKKR